MYHHTWSQSYFFNDDNFNFNYAQAKAVTGNFQEAEEVGVACATAVITTHPFTVDVPTDQFRKDQNGLCLH